MTMSSFSYHISGCYGRRIEKEQEKRFFEQRVTTTLGSIFVLFNPSPEDLDGEGENMVY